MKENIEEDIIVLEQYLIAIDTFGTIDYKCITNLYEPIKNILSDHKRILKENEVAKEALKKQCDIADERNQLLIENQKLQKENEELKEKWDKDTHKLQNDLDIANAERIDWEKAYQEEKDKQDELALHIITLVKKVNNSIPKQKIKDKIEEIEKAYEESKDEYGETPYYYPNYTIEILQDLLEEKGE